MSAAFKKITPKQIVISLLLSLLVSLVFYLKIFDGFFQQDEWYGFGWFVLHKNLNLMGTLGYIFAPSVAHFNPLNMAVIHVMFSLFGMNYLAFSFLSLFLHLLVCALIFFVSLDLFQDVKVSALVVIFFSTLASQFQATAWVIADLATHFSTILGLLSSLFFIKFLKKKKMGYLNRSLLFLTVSLFFKEITIGLFPLYFGSIFLFFEKKKRKEYLSRVTIVGFIYFTFRILMIFAPNTTGDSLVTKSQSIKKLIYNFVTIPIKAFSQSILPSGVLIWLSDKLAYIFPERISGMAGSPERDTFVVKRVLEFLSIFISSSIIYLLIRKISKLWKKEKERAKYLIFFFSWVVLNSFIFSFAPERSGVIFIIDSRNLYFVSVGMVFSIFLFISSFSKRINLKRLVMFLLPLILLNAYWLNRDLADFTKRGRLRKIILEQIKTDYPTLPQQVIFYTESSEPYYGLPETDKILPFQSGLGQTLLVWYYPSEQFNKVFFEKRFLWDITEEGYREVGNRGFGYFRNLEKVTNALKENDLDKSVVIGYRWNGKALTLIDISEEIRKKL